MYHTMNAKYANDGHPINVAIYMYKLNVVRIQLQLDQVITTSYNKLRYEVIYVGILLRILYTIFKCMTLADEHWNERTDHLGLGLSLPGILYM